MTQLFSPHAVSVVAQAADPAAPAFDPFLIIMLAVFALLIFSMFRRSKKAQKQQQELHQSLGPGVEVMTTMGLFGTILSVDKDENKAVIELSPGTTATVHLQAIGKAVNPVQPVDPDTTVPDSPAGLEDTANGTARHADTNGNGPEDERPDNGRPSSS